MSIKILIADGHQIVREGLRSLFQQQPDMAVIGEAEDAPTTIRLAAELSPDVIVMDLYFPSLHGIDATRRILEHNKNIKVIALSVRCDKQIVGEMMRAGGMGYLPKDSAFRELVTAIRTVLRGRVYLSPDVANLVIEGFVRQTPSEQGAAIMPLSPRERQVLQLVAEGMTTKEIAASLGIGVKTIDTHRQDIMARLNLHSVAALTKYAIREGQPPTSDRRQKRFHG